MKPAAEEYQKELRNRYNRKTTLQDTYRKRVLIDCFCNWRNFNSRLLVVKFWGKGHTQISDGGGWCPSCRRSTAFTDDSDGTCQILQGHIQQREFSLVTIRRYQYSPGLLPDMASLVRVHLVFPTCAVVSFSYEEEEVRASLCNSTPPPTGVTPPLPSHHRATCGSHGTLQIALI